MKKFDFLTILTAVLLTTGLLLSCNETTKHQSSTPLKAAVMVAEGFHDTEAYLPMGYLINQGYEVTVIGPSVGVVKSYNTEFTIKIHKAISDVTVNDFDILILPGGKGPGVLRTNEEALALVRDFANSGKVLAAICHGPEVLISADVIKGYNSGGLIKMRDEIESAGATYIDESVVIDRNLVTAKIPKDLYDFSVAIDKTARSLN